MLSRAHRFHGLNSLRPVYKFGKTSRYQQIAVRYKLNDKRRVYRCAVVVSKKVEKSAVKRNRIRRRLFEAVRQIETRINNPYDIVISVYSSSLNDIAAKEVNRQVEKLLIQAGIIDGRTTK